MLVKRCSIVILDSHCIRRDTDLVAMLSSAETSFVIVSSSALKFWYWTGSTRRGSRQEQYKKSLHGILVRRITFLYQLLGNWGLALLYRYRHFKGQFLALVHPIRIIRSILFGNNVEAVIRDDI